ncbi:MULTISPECIES: hypothetical protein [unclassified Fusibacter]|uniref:hypothetical protein n=1 Tax=unclassified Fusibacter TaxID=2624464 RepID=UPI001010B144|nr:MULTISPECIES: hypothetical protein [unclassified Fusibacter]MCK8061677.1 hypothetical protein [Fusibacter sp. A2]NPE23861.1 hypothetical protein [Fusibacter sp. A1]RXV58575.1 hypothetical protein DWB64_18920 [Fusibacter sp. A1]
MKKQREILIVLMCFIAVILNACSLQEAESKTSVEQELNDDRPDNYLELVSLEYPPYIYTQNQDVKGEQHPI